MYHIRLSSKTCNCSKIKMADLDSFHSLKQHKILTVWVKVHTRITLSNWRWKMGYVHSGFPCQCNIVVCTVHYIRHSLILYIRLYCTDTAIYSGKAFSKLQNDTLFIEIDQNNQVLSMKYYWKFLFSFIFCSLFSPIPWKQNSAAKSPHSMFCITNEDAMILKNLKLW